LGVRKGYAFGVDVGATNVRVGVGDTNGRILKKIYEKTDKTHGSRGISQQIIRLIYTLQEETQTNILGIGIGSIGPLDLKRGAITNSPNIPFKFVPLREPIENEFATSIILLNDCNAAVVGERLFGAGKGFNHLVYVTLSTGVGGGVFVDGHLLLGKDGNASEVGHIVIDVEGRLRCGCGKRGHWEAYCSGKNIPNYVRMVLNEVGGTERSLKQAKSAPQGITAKQLFEAAEHGDQLSLDIVDSIGRLNATAFASLINLYDPSIIVVGGALALKHDVLILNPITRYIPDYVINRIPEIVITPLREDVVFLGAIAAVYNPNYAFFKS
jgi:glucokinase